MAHLSVNEGPSQDTPLPDLPPEYRRIRASSRGGRLVRALHTDCRGLADFLQEAEQADWAGLGSREAFIQDCLGRPVDVIDLALEGVKLFDLSEPVPFNEAVNAAHAKRARERTQAAAANPETGKVLPKHTKPDVQFAHQSQEARAEQGGVSRRTQIKLDALARQAPELLEQVKEGRLSAHAAAIEAGIVKVPSNLDKAKKAIAKLTADELQDFTDWFSDYQ